MRQIGMLVAVELDSVLRRYGSPENAEELGGFRVFNYRMDGYELHVINSGVGELAAAAATQLLIGHYRAELVVNFGVVGGLTEEMAQARTVIVEKLVHYDFDISQIDPLAPGQYPGYDSVYIPTTPALVEKAVSLEPSLKRVVCASADKFVAGQEAKAALHARFGADICEMESAGVVLTCNRCGVPCLVIKTVSDGITSGAEEFYAEVQRTSALCLDVTDRIIRGL